MNSLQTALAHDQSFTDDLLAALAKYRKPQPSPYCCDDTDTPCRDCVQRAIGEGYDESGTWIPDAISAAFASGLSIGHDGMGSASPPAGMSGEVALAWWRGHSEGLSDLLDEMSRSERVAISADEYRAEGGA